MNKAILVNVAPDDRKVKFLIQTLRFLGMEFAFIETPYDSPLDHFDNGETFAYSSAEHPDSFFNQEEVETLRNHAMAG